ncbi:hypothetical protein K9L05_01840 [Candidatus Babeliales bacterium]|nr:hypothetical protein [Candidatus Babeliales bacterium]MCF7899369.1 hypothetical protein [Candidatus Babeliales bacterium]
MDKRVFLVFFLSFFVGLIYSMQEEGSLQDQDSETEIDYQDVSTQTDEVFFMSSHEQFLLGIEYLNYKENKEALKLFELAAQKHHIRAQFMAATMLYDGGKCSSRYLMKAFKYCRRSAVRGHVPAKELLKKIQIDLIEYLLKENKKPISINMEEILKSITGADEDKEKKEDDIPVYKKFPGIYI